MLPPLRFAIVHMGPGGHNTPSSVQCGRREKAVNVATQQGDLVNQA